jgi:hypothetical protein
MITKGALTTNGLLKSIKRRAMVPTSQDTFTDDDIIDFMNEEMMIGLVPTILQQKDEYLIFQEERPLIANQAYYPVPERALYNKLREVSYKLDDQGGTEYEMSQIAVDDKYTYLINAVENSNWRRFYMEGGDLVLFPKVGDSPRGSLMFYYYMRPNNLVADNKVAVITGINRTTGVVSFASTLPSGYSSGDLFDFIKAKSPHSIIDIDKVALNTSVSGKTVTFAIGDIPDSLIIGDMVALAGETCIPNVPTELHSVLAQRVAQRILEAIGDTQGLTNSQNKLTEMEAKMAIGLDNRVEGAPRKAVNRHGTLRQKRGITRGGMF